MEALSLVLKGTFLVLRVAMELHRVFVIPTG
jgi:hypothetical protein